MTIHQMSQRLAVVMAAASPEDRLRLNQSWLKSVVEFNQRTEELRFENWKRS
jgi:hypothetical protein